MKISRDVPYHSSVYADGSSSSESGRNHSLERKHFCVICNKQFGCGKAYGGHVRIHSNEYSNKGKTKEKKKVKRKIYLVNKKKEKVEGKIKCCLCGKEFKTMHSLFGHMRRHPDRNWKGIRPPSPENSKDDDDVMSRCRSMMSDVTKDVQEGACCLMMLSYSTKMKKDMETSTSEVRRLSCDMKIKMEIEVKMSKAQDNEEAKKLLDFDLNQPYNDQDHPNYSDWN